MHNIKIFFLRLRGKPIDQVLVLINTLWNTPATKASECIKQLLNKPK